MAVGADAGDAGGAGSDEAGGGAAGGADTTPAVHATMQHTGIRTRLARWLRFKRPQGLQHGTILGQRDADLCPTTRQSERPARETVRLHTVRTRRGLDRARRARGPGPCDTLPSPPRSVQWSRALRPHAAWIAWRGTRARSPFPRSALTPLRTGTRWQARAPAWTLPWSKAFPAGAEAGLSPPSPRVASRSRQAWAAPRACLAWASRPESGQPHRMRPRARRLPPAMQDRRISCHAER